MRYLHATLGRAERTHVELYGSLSCQLKLIVASGRGNSPPDYFRGKPPSPVPNHRLGLSLALFVVEAAVGWLAGWLVGRWLLLLSSKAEAAAGPRIGVADSAQPGPGRLAAMAKASFVESAQLDNNKSESAQGESAEAFCCCCCCSLLVSCWQVAGVF